MDDASVKFSADYWQEDRQPGPESLGLTLRVL